MCPRLEPLAAHKLLYYAQGWHLAWTGEAIFGDEIEAWAIGPIVPSIWDEDYADLHADWGPSDTEQITLDFVAERYGRLGTRALIERSRSEQPWLKASLEPSRTPVISRDLLRSSFRTWEIEAAEAIVQDAAWVGALSSALARLNVETPGADDLGGPTRSGAHFAWELHGWTRELRSWMSKATPIKDHIRLLNGWLHRLRDAGPYLAAYTSRLPGDGLSANLWLSMIPERRESGSSSTTCCVFQVNHQRRLVRCCWIDSRLSPPTSFAGS